MAWHGMGMGHGNGAQTAPICSNQSLINRLGLGGLCLALGGMVESKVTRSARNFLPRVSRAHVALCSNNETTHPNGPKRGPVGKAVVS